MARRASEISAHQKQRSLRRRFGQLLLMVLLTACTFVFVEGLSSIVLFLRDAVQEGKTTLLYYTSAEDRRHAQYDETLGWAAIPNRYIPDLYGAGKYLRTDSHGFRSDEEITPTVPAGKIRIICSGDSFAFGQGVANDRTWCHLLSTKDPRLQAVNMGQRGYGVDQAYLWYRRDGTMLDHDLHLFSFIGGDFVRMWTSSHHGYGKPVLALEDGQLTVGNTPVPRFRLRRPWMARLGRAAESLSSVELAGRLLRKLLTRSTSFSASGTRAVAGKVVEDLDRLNRDRQSVLVLVWLPVMDEIEQEKHGWRDWVADFSAASDIPFIDLSIPLRQLPPDRARGLFISESDTAYTDAAGHYNEDGHQWVADELYRRLSRLEETQELLSEVQQPAEDPQ